MRIFVTKPFARFADRENIDNHTLREAIDRAERGLVDADLGGGVIKQRIARRGQGRSGGYRSIILFRFASRAIFLFKVLRRRTRATSLPWNCGRFACWPRQCWIWTKRHCARQSATELLWR